MIEKISLNALKFFYAVSKYGSVTQAATKLFVTQSAVSKQIQNLEEVLNVQLFERKNKKMLLSAQGAELFDCCEKIFADLEECLMSIQHEQQYSNKLIVSCETTLAMKWLIPRLSNFNQYDNSFEIVLLTGGGEINLEKNQIDLAIRRNDFEWCSELYAEKIADETMVLVRNRFKPDCSDILISSSRPNLWQNLNKNTIWKKQLTQFRKVELEHFYLCLEGCMAGLGATVCSKYMVERELENQIFEMILPEFTDQSAYYLLSSKPFVDDPRKLVFLKWLKLEMKN